jgi:GT2 family glycosyltransferase
MSSQPKVAIIVLNYNSWQDTAKCVSLCLRQDYPDFLVIVVDNGSSDGSIEKLEEAWRAGIAIKYWAQYAKGEAETGGTEAKERELDKYGAGEKLVLIRNDRNLGYSAGNNVGIRYAVERKADAVLIVNPDVVLEDDDVIALMVTTLFEADDIEAVGPRVIDMQGQLENPLYEPTFLGEFLLPYVGLIRDALWKRTVQEMNRQVVPIKVSKIVGCCILLKTTFLKEINFLDDNIFLYCEEAILAAQIEARGKKIFFEPRVKVRHLHRGTRGNLEIFLESRRYYLKMYKKYGGIKMFLIGITQRVIKLKYHLANLF